jgi:hypothetical protein
MEYADLYVRDVRESAIAYRANPYYPVLVEKAARKGFAPAPIGLLIRSVRDPAGWSSRLYTWAGGVWVRQDDAEALAYEGGI